jgi:hypothetical protein
MPMPKPAEGTESDIGVLGGGLRCRMLEVPMPAASPSMSMPSHGLLINSTCLLAGWWMGAGT